MYRRSRRVGLNYQRPVDALRESKPWSVRNCAKGAGFGPTGIVRRDALTLSAPTRVRTCVHDEYVVARRRGFFESGLVRRRRKGELGASILRRYRVTFSLAAHASQDVSTRRCLA